MKSMIIPIKYRYSYGIDNLGSSLYQLKGNTGNVPVFGRNRTIDSSSDYQIVIPTNLPVLCTVGVVVVRRVPYPSSIVVRGVHTTDTRTTSVSMVFRVRKACWYMFQYCTGTL